MRCLKDMFLLNVVVILSTAIHGQNLIANPNFSDVNTCSEQDAHCAPEAWLMTSPHIPIHKDDRVLIVVHNSSKRNVRQYLQTQLLQELKKGQTYQLKIRLKAGDCVVNSFGIRFEDEFVCFKKDDLIEHPDIDLSSQFGQVRKRKQRKWMEFSVNYTARGDEKFILIGCFDSYRNQEQDFRKKPEPYKNYYYYIDEVQLIDPKIDSLPESALRVRDHLYAYDDRHTFCNYVPYQEPEVIPSGLEDKNHSQAESIFDHQPDTIVFSDVLFEFNSSELNKDATNTISQEIDRIDIASIKKIEINGYTDNVGNQKYNDKLSKERAESVKEFLMSIGVEDELIKTNGLGSRNPVASNSTEDGRAQNRRIEIYFEYKN